MLHKYKGLSKILLYLLYQLTLQYTLHPIFYFYIQSNKIILNKKYVSPLSLSSATSQNHPQTDTIHQANHHKNPYSTSKFKNNHHRVNFLTPNPPNHHHSTTRRPTTKHTHTHKTIYLPITTAGPTTKHILKPPKATHPSKATKVVTCVYNQPPKADPNN